MILRQNVIVEVARETSTDLPEARPEGANKDQPPEALASHALVGPVLSVG
jgi:hypothetical protein